MLALDWSCDDELTFYDLGEYDKTLSHILGFLTTIQFHFIHAVMILNECMVEGV